MNLFLGLLIELKDLHLGSTKKSINPLKNKQLTFLMFDNKAQRHLPKNAH